MGVRKKQSAFYVLDNGFLPMQKVLDRSRVQMQPDPLT